MPIRRNPKQVGELAEVAFLHKAMSLGFIVSKPYGDSAPYDFVLGWGRRLRRVQVRSASSAWRGAYRINTRWRGDRHKQNYTSREIDVVVGYIPPEDAWYIFPLFVISHLKTVRINPGAKGGRGRYEKWRDRWDLLSNGSKTLQRRRKSAHLC